MPIYEGPVMSTNLNDDMPDEVDFSAGTRLTSELTNALAQHFRISGH